VIPSCEEIIEGWAFVARRLGRAVAVNRSAVAAAVAEARELAPVAADEPAALFYAFCRHPRALPGGWRVMPRLLAGMHCRRLGLRLRADADELDGLRTEIVTARLSFQETRLWFRNRTDQIASSPE
jgi:hypothetical protein